MPKYIKKLQNINVNRWNTTNYRQKIGKTLPNIDTNRKNIAKYRQKYSKILPNVNPNRKKYIYKNIQNTIKYGNKIVQNTCEINIIEKTLHNISKNIQKS